MSEISSNSNDKAGSRVDPPVSSSSSEPMGNGTSSRRDEDPAALTCLRPLNLDGFPTTCGTPYRYLGPQKCPFPKQAPTCPYAQPTDETPTWVPGGHVQDEFKERRRRVHLDVEYVVFGTAQHIEKTVSVLERLLELHGYTDAFINVRPDDGP
jgi:hypothetical protein